MEEKPEYRHPEPWRRLAGEAVGTFVLTFAAAGADVVEYASGGGIGHAARYLAPAIAVTAMIWSLSGSSGAHLNPAVTCAFVLRGTVARREAPAYIGAQLAGAVVAACVLKAIFGPAIGHAITRPTPPFTTAQAFATEVMLTFVLVLTILGTGDQKPVVGKNAALAVGGVVALCGLGFSPVSGASMNPARSFGPMLAALQFGNLWLYVSAPLVGVVLAAAIVHVVYGPPSSDDFVAAGGRAR